MIIKQVFDTFVSELKKRVGFLSEDNIRFYWFASMLKQDQDLNHYSLEEPYGVNIPGNKELDLMYKDGIERWCIEIKFHRNPNGRTFALPQSAGEIFDDIRRLPSWSNGESDGIPTRYFFLYVTDDEMHKYLSNSANRKSAYRDSLADFYNLAVGAVKGFTFEDSPNGDTPKTFFHQALESYTAGVQHELQTPNVIMVASDDITCPSSSMKKIDSKSPINCHIRLYEVMGKGSVLSMQMK